MSLEKKGLIEYRHLEGILPAGGDEESIQILFPTLRRDQNDSIDHGNKSLLIS